MIQTSHIDKVFTLTLDRPEKRNALDLELLRELAGSLELAASLQEVSLLVIRGNGPVFCAGADLDFVRQLNEKVVAYEFAGLLTHVLEHIRNFPVPVICLVQGACMGGANGIVAASDIVMADVNTRFAFSEVRLGLVPAVISPFVLARMGISRASDLMLTGRMFDATEAKHAGLINYTGTSGEMDFWLKQTIMQVRSSAPGALRETRKLIWKMPSGNWQELLRLGNELFVKVATSDEAREGISAFFEKRNPSWMVNGNSKGNAS